ncbi:MAG: RsmB/NOP family class I SAM-dependent RNA methyltransferase [Rhizobiaceae bacterium]|nr:RsmB/NOP family class I SAM-dependent RNA methyltransferase [Rhizobiaceae bacterium]
MGPQPHRPTWRAEGPLALSGRPAAPSPKRQRDRSHRPAPPPDAPGLAARKAATRLLAAVVDAHTPLDGLTDNEHGHPQYMALEARDRALVRAILATALRFRRSIEALIGARLRTPLPANASTLSHILHVGAAQILHLDVPDSAAVDLAVTHAKSDPRTLRFAALVNAVLRAVARAKHEPRPDVDEAPGWFSDRLRGAYGPETAAAILSAHRLEAPVDLTVKSDPAGWASRLGGTALPTGTVRLRTLSGPVSEMPGYAEGAWWVQDAAAALPARLFGNLAGRRVADLCAAPGGKTAQLALAGAAVTAVDTSASRLARLRANMTRLGLSVEAVKADLTAYRPAELFDAVLLDAPCSSTGTVRRHPDVPWTKVPADIETLAGVQRRLLDHAIGLVRPGGVIVFSNCSLDPLEGESLAQGVLATDDRVEGLPLDAAEVPDMAAWLTPEGWLRTTPAGMVDDDPGLSGMDGFFAARFRRKA